MPGSFISSRNCPLPVSSRLSSVRRRLRPTHFFGRELLAVSGISDSSCRRRTISLLLFIDPASVIVCRHVIVKDNVLEPRPLEDRQGRASLEVFILPRNRGINDHFCFSDETPIHQFSSSCDGIVSMGFDITSDVY